MDFELSSDQKTIVKTVAEFVKKELPISRMRKMRSDPTGFSRDMWKQMGDLGWLGIAMPGEVGGFGGTFVDAALIVEQFGTALVSEPYSECALVAGHALLFAGTTEQHAEWLAPLIAGESVVTLAWTERGTRYNPAHVQTRAERTAQGYHLTGEKTWVLAGNAADQYLVCARTSGVSGSTNGLSLFVVHSADPGVTVVPLSTMDGRKAAHLTFNCTLPASRLLGEERQAYQAVTRALDIGAAAACSEGVGVMKVALAMTVEYLKTREQFGTKIGTFQALQHRAVDMFIETELAKSTAIMASIKVSDENAEERERAVSAAKVNLAQSGKYVAAQSIQLHGGIGVTDEHDIGLYFKRMQILATLWGDEEHHLTRFSSLPSFTAGM
ncbi:MAG: acyl-CoA dehydrogenase family protein [Polyangiaceae bacterium]|nr:acyl-CoA dehydrogenase family protein [Polyangiaceae bacterium]